MAKTTVRKDITEAGKGLKEIMREGLAKLGDSLIAKIMSNYRSAQPANKINAYKNTDPSGLMDYKNALKDALAVIAKDAMDKARKEIPKKKNLRLDETLEDTKGMLLSEFDGLPPDVKKRVQAQTDLLVGTQTEDLKKAVYFQFNHSVDSTDSESLVEADMTSAAEDYIDGGAIDAGSMVTAAKTINDARNDFFFDDGVLDEVDAFQFVNGDPVTDICQELNGTIFAKDDPELDRNTPPLHWNCKSYIIPILKGNLGDRDITGLPSLSKKAQEQIQFAECPSCGHR